MANSEPIDKIVNIEKEPYFPNHDEFGAWDCIFYEHIFPKITRIFDLLKCLQLEKRCCDLAGDKIHANEGVDWSDLESFCCKNTLPCGERHENLDAMSECEICTWSVPLRFDAMKKGRDFLVNTHGGMKKRMIYNSWPERHYFTKLRN